MLRECRRLGIVTIATATNVVEAEALDAAGVDVIVALGSEAGGHRRSFLHPAAADSLAVSALVPQIVDRVRARVVAAGRGAVAAMILGAQGVQALVEPTERSTILTRAFSGRYACGLVQPVRSRDDST